MPIGYNKLAEGLGKAIETVPELYDDALKTAAQESGKTITLIPQSINAALVPLRQWIAHREYNMEETKNLLAQKLAHISQEKIVTPEPYVAVPAIQAISYSMNSDELRELYANLLVKSMNTDTKNSVHPAFVEIIKQLSPVDAKVLKEISSNNFLPIAFLSASQYAGSPTNARIDYYVNSLEYPLKKYEFSNITPIQFLDYESVSLSIDNLMRQRLIEQRYNFTEGIHTSITNSPLYTQCRNELEQHVVNSHWRYEETPSSLWFTNLGRSFSDVCIKNI
jgi:hypothetical protein